MTGQTRRKPSVRALAPQRTAATHASGAHEFSYRSPAPNPTTLALLGLGLAGLGFCRRRKSVQA